MERGGFAEGVVRIILAVAGANKATDRRQYAVAGKIIQVNERLKDLTPDKLKWQVKQQSAVLEKDPALALKTLTALLPEKDDRIEAFEIANSIASADLELDAPEQELLSEIKDILGL
jgi:tellurite resistance protein